ncbi:GTPase domain-containing protein [Thermoplasma sp.]|uniref:GTPase domain-containing protein n=1 Tax=Thermoplasma sp. TaxID=1973142 RepID=UPI00127D98EF|nr:GTPase domain-containing protein [Thermoplasma sp.]KAA8922840.1 MAG: GTPase domain-containing protein [Thermoplasma sp.]
MPIQKLAWKFLVIGSKGSGKSSFISFMVYGEMAPGIPRSMIKKTVTREIDGKRYSVDILFQEADEDAGKVMGTATGMIVIIDLTNPESLGFAEKVIARAYEMNKINVYIVGNKTDLKYEAQIWKEDLEKLSKRFGSKFYMVSCKDGTGFDGILDDMVDKIISRNVLRK